jgi:hypothetical protein
MMPRMPRSAMRLREKNRTERTGDLSRAVAEDDQEIEKLTLGAYPRRAFPGLGMVARGFFTCG